MGDEFLTERETLKRQLDAYSENGETTKRLKNLQTVMFQTYQSVSASTELQTALVQLFEFGVLTDATNFTHILNEMNYSLNHGATNADELKASIKAVTDLGEEEWGKLTSGIEDLAQYLEITDGITIKTEEDLTNFIDIIIPKIVQKLKQQLKSINNEEIFAQFDDKIQKASQRIITDWTKDLEGGIGEDDFRKQQLEDEWKLLEEQKQLYYQELEILEDNSQQKLEVEQAYYDVVAQMRENDWELEKLALERKRALIKDSIAAFQTMNDSISTVLGSVSSLIQQEVQEGKLSKEEAAKKIKTLKTLEKVQLAVALANIAASTASGVQDVWRAYAGELVVNAQRAAAAGLLTGGLAGGLRLAKLNAESKASAILRTTSLVATGLANMAAASMGTVSALRGYNQQLEEYDGGGTSAGVGATPTLIDSTPYSYTRQLQTTEEEEQLNRPIYVTVTDIEEGLNNKVKVVSETSF